MVIDNFLREDYDILIDLSLKKFYPLTYLAVASPAKFKVGRCRNDISVYDLSIDNSKKQNLAYLIDKIDHYLNLGGPFRYIDQVSPSFITRFLLLRSFYLFFF